MNKKILERFGKKVEVLRGEKGWTQEKLGKKACLHRTYIGSIERGERNVSLINVEKIAKALGVPPTKLIK